MIAADGPEAPTYPRFAVTTGLDGARGSSRDEELLAIRARNMTWIWHTGR